jgi:HSP90 family molecular chaperone
MELLIKPLYGNNPSIGIRELLQNAVDATKERMNLERILFQKLIKNLQLN